MKCAKKKLDLLSIFVTLIVISILFFSGPASAVRVGIIGFDDTTPDEESTLSFTAYVDIESMERIPISNITISITNSGSCVFGVEGNEISGDLCSNIVITPNNNYNYTTGQRWGYDTSGSTGNHSFSDGFGYEYKTGYDYTASPYGELSYSVVWTTPSVTEETNYLITMSVKSDQNTSYQKTSQMIRVQDTIAVASSSSSSHSSIGSFPSIIGDEDSFVSTSQSWLNSQAGDQISMPVNKDSVSVDELFFTLDEDKGFFKLTVNKLEERPESLPVLNDKVYQYVEFDDLNIDPDDVSDIEMVVKVEKSWLESEGLGKEGVSLYVYEDEWSELDTVFFKESDEYVYYKVKSPVLSYCAVAESVNNMNTIADNQDTISGKAIQEIESPGQIPVEDTDLLVDGVDVEIGDDNFFKVGGNWFRYVAGLVVLFMIMGVIVIFALRHKELIKPVKKKSSDDDADTLVKLKKFIKDARKKGYSDSEIKTLLKSHGWDDETIDIELL